MKVKVDEPFRIKITVKTPKNQAVKCIETQKKAILGFKHKHKVIEQKVVSDRKFFWIVQVESYKDIMEIGKKAAKGEILIKKFYSTLFHLVDRANKLDKKFRKGTIWVKGFIMKRLRKIYKDEQGGMADAIENMNSKELEDFLNIEDKEEMQKLLSGNLISIDEI